MELHYKKWKWSDLIPAAIALIREGEGTTLVLPVAVAAAEGFDATQPMAWITLNVHSALDGVGLTAAVSTALADAQIAVNVIAAFHHDHLFVPEAQAARAIEVLRQAASAAG